MPSLSPADKKALLDSAAYLSAHDSALERALVFALDAQRRRVPPSPQLVAEIILARQEAMDLAERVRAYLADTGSDA